MKDGAKVTKEVETFVLDQGADLVGFASIDRFRNAPDGYRPQDYMRDAAVVISIAVGLARGICNIWGDYTKPGKTIGPYMFFGGGQLINLELGRIANRTAKWLEQQKFNSLPFPPAGEVSTYRWRGLRQGEALADFSHKHAAIAAGLGEIGWSNLVITPRFGPRVRLISLITNAPLEPSPMYQGPALCQPDRCGFFCVKNCPAQALSMSESRVAVIGEKEYKYAKIDRVRHSYGISGLVKGSGSIRCVDIPPGPGDYRHYQEALQNQRAVDRAMRQEGTAGFCSICQHQCPAPF